MSIVSMKDMLQHAYTHGYAVSAFDLVSLDMLEGIMTAAERCRSPVILNLAETQFDYFDFELLMPAVEAAARRASVPVAIHLHHGANLNSAVRAINLGCNSVMVDVTYEAFTENIQRTREVVRMAQDCGVPVEGELGYLPYIEEASRYVEQTGVDFLAIPLSAQHSHMGDDPKQDYLHLQQLSKSVRIPLVINRGASLSDKQIRDAIAHGVAKINFETALCDTASLHIRYNVGGGQQGGYTELMQGVSDAIRAEAEACMHIGGSVGRAAELLSQCTQWAPVEHLIIYNVSNTNDDDIEAMLVEGKLSLSTIPGVREIITGRAVKENAQYSYCWLIRFCHPAVIDSYREHPTHVAFADMLFRPVASDRISIDYLRVEQTPVLERLC